MSSTGRGAERAALDNYPTPGWVTRAILPYLPLGGRILEPAVGAGAIVRELVDAHADPKRIVGVDIAPGFLPGLAPDLPPIPAPANLTGLARVDTCNFLTWTPPLAFEQFELVITNPPYALAQEFVHHARGFLAPDGRCAMLLRLNFLGSQRRASWLRDWLPDVYVLPRRPSFTGKGTDSCEYAWFVWRQAATMSPGRLHILDVDAP